MNLYNLTFVLCLFISISASCCSRNYTKLLCGWTSITVESLFGSITESLPPLDVEFRLYTRKNPSYYQNLVFGDESSIIQSNFMRETDTKFLIHGYTSSANQGYYLELKTAILATRDINVIIVDWAEGASKFYYPGAITNSYRCGKEIAKMIEFLQNTANLKLSQVHLIGFSLGGQVAGFTGKRLNKVSRISAIDPAGVCFDAFPVKYRLNRTDADFVDLLITTAGEIGMVIPVGHINIYLNGGHIQPGCSGKVINRVRGDIFSSYAIIFDNCSHSFAIEFYKETILYPECNPLAYRCSDYENFLEGQCFNCGENGEDCALAGIEAYEYRKFKEDVDRIFYIKTAGSSPFCLYHYQITIILDTSQNNFTGVYGKSVLTFLGVGGKNITISNDRLDLYEPGKIYTHLMTSQYDVLPATQAWFFWYFYPIYGKMPRNPQISLKRVELKPMNEIKRGELSSVYIFHTKEAQSISPGEKITLFLK
ncbi:endothelial lipase-like isoform X1 [Centruroides vittatus]|uniref:endothelial lipase-like isoform X1 n=1 Tax=Centruroides vittatus TaxID=120091 RepID=UPI00350EB9DF